MTVDSHSLWVFIHILLFVYWLGADLGVFVGAIWAKNRALSVPERMTLLKLTLVLDMTPRTTFPLMMPVGLHLAAGMGWVTMPGWGLAAAWIVALGWIVLIWSIPLSEGKPRQQLLMRGQTVWLALVGAAWIAAGVASFNDGVPFATGWLAAKAIGFGAICYLAIFIDIVFKPAVPAFIELATKGSSDAVESVIGGTINKVLLVVLTLYAVLALMAFLGTVKPF
jgi:hypothetical protein